MEMAGLFMLSILGIASAGNLGHHDSHNSGHHSSHNSGHHSSHNSGQHSSHNLGQHGPSFGRPVQVGPGQFVPSPGQGSADQVIDVSINGIITFDNYDGMIRYGVLQLLGNPISNIGESGEYTVLAGTGTLRSGQTVFIDGGSVNVRVLGNTDTDTPALQNALARAGITRNQLIQLTGTIPPQQGIFVVTAGDMSINGVLRNIRAGVFIVLSLDIVDPNTGGVQPAVGPQTPIRPQPAVGPVDLVQTLTITETAAHETVTVSEQVILTKKQTRDEFVTITSPIYHSIAATITNIVKQTVTVPEEQVIRSPVAGSLVVNTIPVPYQTVLTVSARATNFFVQTLTEQVVNTQQHFVTNYSFSTVTVNNPVTTTVVQKIVQTRVSTITNTSTVGSTVYTTITVTVNIGTGGATQTTAPAGGYY